MRHSSSDKENKKVPKEAVLSVVNNDFIAKNSIEVGKAAAGALVSVALGGPIGAIVGAVTVPAISLAQDITSRLIKRRRERLERVVIDAMKLSGFTVNDALSVLSKNESKADDFILLLSSIADSDKSIDAVFKGLLAEILVSETSSQRDRLLIIGDAVKNFRSIHLRVLTALFNAGGVLKANEISKTVGIPEIELRSVVRDLELRGMIKDLETRPLKWKLRELGHGVVKFINMSFKEGVNASLFE